jgi:hypothetical protein
LQLHAVVVDPFPEQAALAPMLAAGLALGMITQFIVYQLV